MPKEYEYHEGKKAQEEFEEGMKALFQVPKDAVKGKKKPAKKRAKKKATSERRFPRFWRELKQPAPGLLRTSAKRGQHLMNAYSQLSRSCNNPQYWFYGIGSF